jgi:hypothetical protein
MNAIVGRDEEGRIWFKSNKSIIEITKAIDFYVESRSWFGLWGRKWYLVARYIEHKYSDGMCDYNHVDLGEYTAASTASLALEKVMAVRGIKEIDFK